MYVQWCVKGISGGVDGINDSDAQDMLWRGGIQCSWWRRVGKITPLGIRQKLTQANLSLHVNNYAVIRHDTPFISLAAGCMERDSGLQTNHLHGALETALDFATDGGLHNGYIFYCWTIVGLHRAAGVEGVSERVGELNVYRSYSAYQTEGEVTAKVYIPCNQIERFEKWSGDGKGLVSFVSGCSNPGFDPPEQLSNIRSHF
ncbi:hypothetical protein [Ferrovibrio terrae]|uniref:hypothetical protein n=1 Tax=Ferrovibrio terrae TaxID=2594003 RepID=UPI003137C069